MSKTLQDYLSVIPQEYHDNITVIGDYCGNRTNIHYKFLCGCDSMYQLKCLIKIKRFDYCFRCINKMADRFVCKYCQKSFMIF